MADIKDFDDKKKKKDDNKHTKDLASAIKNTMWLGLSELWKTIKWGANKQEVKKQESIFVKKWNQILQSEEKREQTKIKEREHIQVF